MTYVQVVPLTRPLQMLFHPEDDAAVVVHVVVQDRGIVDIQDPREDQTTVVAAVLQEVHQGPRHEVVPQDGACLIMEVTSRVSGISSASASGSSVTDLLSLGTSSKSSSNNRSQQQQRKKKTRVKEMKYQDINNGKIGRYTGTVNDDLIPNGEGKVK